MSFEPVGLGHTIFADRYARTPEETWQEACQRVATHVAQAEENGKVRKYAERFKEQLSAGKFNPGGRIWYGAGRPKAQLLNCFVIPTGDSREAWGKTASDTIVISGLMGGVGMNLSPIRGRGTPIKGTGGVATGSVSYGQLINGIGDTIVGGGGRRMALMLALSLNHPDVEEFLSAKLDLQELNNANVSLIIPDDLPTERFQEMVRNREEIELTFNGIPSGKTVNAGDLWDKLVENAYKSGEPGVLNGYLASKMNNIWYHKNLICTNPCITGDTLVAVADGRNAVSIGQLTNEGNDVPVYCSDPVTGQTVIRMGRNPRLTGIKKEVWSLTLDDGSVIRATPDHGFMLRTGEYKPLRELASGDSLRPFNSYESNGYRQIAESGATVGKGGHRRSRRQYRLIWEATNGLIDGGLNVHHTNFKQQDDRLENLELMTEEDHRLLHAERMKGEKNPYWGMTDEWKFAFASHPGESNPKANEITNEELLDHGRICWIQNDGSISQSKWITYAKEHELPQFVANEFRFGTWTNFKLAVAGNHKVKSIEFDGYEDVYNITVEEHHNYHVISSTDETAIRSSGVCVKNCGEIWLEAYGCCDLGALVLPRFVVDGKFDWDAFDESVRLGVRFLDNVLSVNHYPLPEIKENCEQVRRLGLGVMGLHTMLLELGMRYDSPEALKFVDRLFNTMKNTAYDASINLAIEKGAFPAYDPRFLESGFTKTLKRGIRNKIREHGIRNCAILTIAPTGTTSMVAGVSSGIEPIAAPVYWRNYYKPTTDGTRVLERELVVEDAFYKYPEIVESAIDVSLRGHFEMQKTVQKHIDNAVSKTINMAQDEDIQEFSDLWLEYLPYCKGTTVYRFGSRENEPINPVPREQWSEVVQGSDVHGEMTVEEFMSVDCVGGVCEVPQRWQEKVAEEVKV